MGLTTFCWSHSQQEPKIGNLRNDAYGDFSKTFGLLHFITHEIPLGPQAKLLAKWTPKNYLM